MIPRVKPSVLYEIRYCNQNEFDLCVFNSRKNCTNENVTISFIDFKISVTLNYIPPSRNARKTVVLGRDIYMLDKIRGKGIHTNIFEVYSKTEKVCKQLKSIDNRLHCFSTCLFMSSIYVIGGFFGDDYTENCYKYDRIDNSWRQIASLHSKKRTPTCSVFEGKIFATGGMKGGSLKSVESFDYHENKWNIISDMIKTRCSHSSVTIGDKLFVIGGYYRTCSEVYDSNSRKFTMFSLKLPFNPDIYVHSKAVCYDKKIVFHGYSSNRFSQLYVYNVDERKWVTKEIEMKLPGLRLRKIPKQ